MLIVYSACQEYNQICNTVCARYLLCLKDVFYKILYSKNVTAGVVYNYLENLVFLLNLVIVTKMFNFTYFYRIIICQFVDKILDFLNFFLDPISN